MKRNKAAYRVIILSSVLWTAIPSITAITSTNPMIPDVHFEVIRLDFSTLDLVGYYEYDHPYKKTLPVPGDSRIGNVYFFYDYQSCDLYCEYTYKSRLTGETLVTVTSMWDGVGSFIYPPDSLRSTNYTQVLTNPEPDTLIYRGSADYSAAWDKVFNTDIIERLSSLGPYEVFLFDYYYGLGSREWIFIAFTHPPAPVDMGIINIEWPRTLVTKGASFNPEIKIHNFGDETAKVDVRFTLSSPSGTISSYVKRLGFIPSDSDRLVKFNSITDNGYPALKLDFEFVHPLGAIWADAYPENNFWAQDISVTDQPVFRLSGILPRNGTPFDFDGDGDVDFVQSGDYARLLQNDGKGNFTDITDQLPITFRYKPRMVLGQDINADGFKDLLIIHMTSPAQILAGDGTGYFTEVPDDPVLSAIKEFGMAVSLDKENDGDIDFIFQSQYEEVVLENDGAGHFTDVSAESGFIHSGQNIGISSGDFNNDGYRDVLAVRWSSEPIVFINDGKGTFAPLNKTWGFIYSDGGIVLDYDQDGYQDILFNMPGIGDTGVLFRNMGNLTFQDAAIHNLPNSTRSHSADINDDGYPDLVFSRGKLLLNLNGTFVDSTSLLVDAPSYLGSVRFVDLDADNALDVFSERAILLNQSKKKPVPILIAEFQGEAFKNGVELSWKLVIDGNIEGFRLFREDDNTPFGRFIPEEGLLDPNVRSFIDNSVKPEMSYTYTLIVVKREGAEVRSQTVKVITPAYQYALSQNYPNPFNPITTIVITLPEKSHVNLSIYNVEGKLVTTLIDKILESGSQKAVWNGRDFQGDAVSSGVYFYRLKAGKKVLTRKMVLLR